MKKIVLIIALFSFGFSQAQVVVNNNQNIDWYIQNVLAGPGVVISNVTFNGGSAALPNEQVGEFTDATSSIGLNGGLILGSGDVTMAGQPNTGGGSSLGGPSTVGSDTDLASITPNTIFDECVVEFDFIPVGDSISFSYVFASEEYDEFVCGTVNDAFGFFLSGANPAGGVYSAQNLALIPDPTNPSVFTSTPVSINTVNPGVAGSSGAASNCDAIDPNWAAYSVFYAGSNVSSNYEYDGNTVTLTCRAAVLCGATYHIKLAIGDGGDSTFDSGVFLGAGSLGSDGISIYNYSSSGTGVIGEDCGEAGFVVSHSDLTQTDTIYYTIGGNAINGVDYMMIDTFAVLPVGITSDTIFISALQDGLTEPNDTISINLIGVVGCSYSEIVIIDIQPLVASLPIDSVAICFLDDVNINVEVVGGLGPFDYQWNNSITTNNDTVLVQPFLTTAYSVDVTDACGTVSTASFTDVHVQSASISNFTPFSNNIVGEDCGAGGFIFRHLNIPGTDTIQLKLYGTAIMGADYESFDTTLILGPGVIIDTIFINALQDNFDELLDTIFIEIEDYEQCGNSFIVIQSIEPLQGFVNTDSVNICYPEVAPISVATSGGLPPFSYSWSGSSTDNDTVFVSPEVTTTFNVDVRDQCDNSIFVDGFDVWVQCPLTEVNIFTPNGDGDNDFFKLINLEDYPSANIIIYNRWGKVVYEAMNYTNNWDGAHYKTGRDVPEGTYYFIVDPSSDKYEYNSNKNSELQKTFTGYFQIMR